LTLSMNSKSGISVIGTINAGICITFPNGRKLWFDLYPDGPTPLFSHMKDEDWERTKKDPRLSPPDRVFFSHTHPDHFSAVRTEEIHRLWPQVPVYLPDRSVWSGSPDSGELVCIPIAGEEMSMDLDGITVHMLRTQHSGQQFIDVPHYSFLIRYDKKQIFISGDALLTSDKLITYLECIRTDLAILTFPWASITLGRERVEYSIQPSHLLFYHIPGEEKNESGYREAAASGSELVNVPDVRLLMKPFQEEIFDL